MSAIDQQRINELAVEYSINPTDEAFKALYEEVVPIIYHEAYKASRTTGIDTNSILSLFNEAVWQAARGKALREFNGTSNFTQRLHTFFECRVVDEIRYHTTKKRTGVEVSLDCPTVKENGNTYSDLIDAGIDIAETVTDELAFIDALDRFEKVSQTYSDIIRMLFIGYNNEEISEQLFGAKYDEKKRALFYRARLKFREFLHEEGFLLAEKSK